jgi:carbonic anhydrase
MSVIDELLLRHEERMRDFRAGALPITPSLAVAIVTCMDARILLPEVLGLRPGDANVIRNAGATVTDDVLRTLALSHHLLKTQAVMLVGHTGCGLLNLDEPKFREGLIQLTGADAPQTFGAFTDLQEHVRAQVARVRTHPWLADLKEVRGFVYDVQTSRITEIL